MRVKTIKLERFAGPTAASGLFEITGSFEDDVERAVREDHDCNDEGCDIREAREAGFPLVAAWLLEGATECPALDAVRFAYRLRAGGIPCDFAGPVTPSDLPGWADWIKHHETYGVRCPSCGSYTYGSDSWTPEYCANCLAESR